MQIKAAKGSAGREAARARGCRRLLPPLHHLLTPPVIPSSPGEGGGTDSSVRSNRSRRASSRGKKEGSRKHRRWGRRWTNPGVLGRHTGSQSRGALSLWFSSITLPLFFIPVTFFMAPWLLDPGVCCQFSALPCHSASPQQSFNPPTVPVRQCRPCDGLTVTVGLLTFGPALTGKKPVHTWLLHPGANASSDALSAWT